MFHQFLLDTSWTTELQIMYTSTCIRNESQQGCSIAYMSTCQFHLEGQEHGKNRDLPSQGGTLMTIG